MVRQELEPADFETDTGLPRFLFGILTVGLATRTIRVTSVRYFATTNTDYWSSRGDDGEVSNPTTFETAGAGNFVEADEGKQLVISGSTATNGQGGNNNGRFLIATVVDDQTLTLVGPSHGALRVETATPKRLFVDEQHAFKFPDDLGKKIVVSGSSLGNNGTYTIDKLLHPDALTDLQSDATQLAQRTTVAEIVTGAFVSEVDLTWHLLPDFTSESGLNWELSDAGSLADDAVTLRQALPISGGGFTPVVDVAVSRVLSAQILEDETIGNEVIATSPEVLYEYYPFYLADVLSVVRLFVDELTVGGVIPEFDTLSGS